MDTKTLIMPGSLLEDVRQRVEHMSGRTQVVTYKPQQAWVTAACRPRAR
ncbi:MAG: hypothetical protein HY306_08275 [Nitrosomonadales bacterium]|nr:hypothetical protein [Nitrosomonadales bacterium]